MVGLQTLDLAIGVRVPASQPDQIPTTYEPGAQTSCLQTLSEERKFYSTLKPKTKS